MSIDKKQSKKIQNNLKNKEVELFIRNVSQTRLPKPESDSETDGDISNLNTDKVDIKYLNNKDQIIFGYLLKNKSQ